MHVLLIGPRAAGKTTIGRDLAARTGRPFLDLDDRVLARFEQSSVVDVWQTHGEAAWRAAETDALCRVLDEAEPTIVALGGGVPMIPEARQTLINARTASRAWIVYLRAPADVLMQRLQQQPGDRPSLTGDDVAAEVHAVLEQRDPVYEALSEFICDTDTCDEGRCAVLIEHELLRRHA